MTTWECPAFAHSQVLDEPFHGRLERALLPCPGLRVVCVSADGKSVCTSVPVRPDVASCELVIAEDLISNRLGFPGELLVHFAAVDEQGRLGFLLVVLQVLGDLQERRVRDYGDLTLVLAREIEPRQRAKAVARRAETCDALRLERGNHGIDDRLPRLVRVPLEPWGEVEGAFVELLVRYRFAVEDVGHDDFEAVTGKVIRKEPVVVPWDAKRIRKEQDGLVLSIVDLRRGYIALYAANRLDRAFWRALVADPADTILAKAHYRSTGVSGLRLGEDESGPEPSELRNTELEGS